MLHLFYFVAFLSSFVVAFPHSFIQVNESGLDPQLFDNARQDVEAASIAKRDVTLAHQFCTGSDLNVYAEAYKDMLAVLQTAVSTTSALSNYLNGNPGAQSVPTLSGASRSALYTFQTMFGQVLFDSAQGQQNQDGAQRVAGLSTFLSNLLNALGNTQSNMEVHCDEQWLSDKDIFGNGPPAPLTIQNAGFDKRTQRWYDFSSLSPCTINSNLMGWTINWAAGKWGTGIQDTETAMTFCPNWVSKWTSAASQGGIRAIQGTTYGSNAQSLDTFKSDLMVQTMLHEMTHAAAVVGSAFKVDAAGSNSYGWSGVSGLAISNANLAMTNADTVAFWCIAAYMSNNDWATGMSQPIPP